MRAERLDCIQVDYALDRREAAATILPLAADRGMAVMINLPFGRGRLFEAVRGQALPPWAGAAPARARGRAPRRAAGPRLGVALHPERALLLLHPPAHPRRSRGRGRGGAPAVAVHGDAGGNARRTPAPRPPGAGAPP